MGVVPAGLPHGLAVERFQRATILVRSDVFDPVSGMTISIWCGALPGHKSAAAGV